MKLTNTTFRKRSIEYNAILKADWPLKALLRMRLEKNYLQDGLFSPVSNPLLV
jgi:hypothetical protein